MPDQPDEPDFLALAREILSRMTPAERAQATVEGERLGISEEHVILNAIAQLTGDPEAGGTGEG